MLDSVCQTSTATNFLQEDSASVITVEYGLPWRPKSSSYEQPLLCIEVIFQCLVIVEMILGQVRENSRAESAGVHTFQGQCMGGDFHDGKLATLLRKVRQ